MILTHHGVNSLRRGDMPDMRLCDYNFMNAYAVRNDNRYMSVLEGPSIYSTGGGLLYSVENYTLSECHTFSIQIRCELFDRRNLEWCSVQGWKGNSNANWKFPCLQIKKSNGAFYWSVPNATGTGWQYDIYYPEARYIGDGQFHTYRCEVDMDNDIMDIYIDEILVKSWTFPQHPKLDTPVRFAIACNVDGSGGYWASMKCDMWNTWFKIDGVLVWGARTTKYTKSPRFIGEDTSLKSTSSSGCWDNRYIKYIGTSTANYGIALSENAVDFNGSVTLIEHTRAAFKSDQYINILSGLRESVTYKACVPIIRVTTTLPNVSSARTTFTVFLPNSDRTDWQSFRQDVNYGLADNDLDVMHDIDFNYNYQTRHFVLKCDDVIVLEGDAAECDLSYPVKFGLAVEPSLSSSGCAKVDLWNTWIEKDGQLIWGVKQ